MIDTQNTILYAIDGSDEIATVSGEWDRFALENDCPSEILAGNILHRGFWDFISGDAIIYVYGLMLARVRNGDLLNFSFRCDSPSLRRFLTLRMSPVGRDGVKFVTETVCTEEREFQPLLDAKTSRVDEIVMACSWCNKIKTGVNIWKEAEDAVRELDLFETDAMPSLSHGMCDPCYESVLVRVNDR